MAAARSPTPCFFALGESRELGAQVAAAAGLAPAPLEERTFEGGEFKLRPLESVRGRTAFVLQSLAGSAAASASDRLVRLLFLLRCLRDGAAERVVAVIPYFAFARKDRRTQPRDPVTMRYVAELLEAAGAGHVVALDVHNPAALDNAFRIPVDHLAAAPMMADHFARTKPHDELAVVSPDIGGVKRAQIFRELLEARSGRDAELVFVEKRRTGGVASSGRLVGEVKGKHVIVLDDLCATGGTLIRAAEACRSAGAAGVYATVTHAPLAAGIQTVLKAAAVSGVVITDSVGIGQDFAPARESAKLTILPVAPLLGEAVRRIAEGRPVAPLLSHWPVPAEA